MFIKSETETKLDAEILSALSKLENLEPKSEEYGTIVDHIAQLHKLKTEETGTTIKIHEMETKNRFKQISPDTVLIVAANIFGILWVTRYEKTDVINTKALGFGLKPR